MAIPPTDGTVLVTGKKFQSIIILQNYSQSDTIIFIKGTLLLTYGH